jgi:hypothetical protein
VLRRDEKGFAGIPFKRLLLGGVSGGMTLILARFAFGNLAFVLAVTSGLTLLSLKRSDEPTLYCANVNGGGDAYRILVIGESWASDGKILPELARACQKT